MAVHIVSVANLRYREVTVHIGTMHNGANVSVHINASSRSEV